MARLISNPHAIVQFLVFTCMSLLIQPEVAEKGISPTLFGTPIASVFC